MKTQNKTFLLIKAIIHRCETWNIKFQMTETFLKHFVALEGGEEDKEMVERYCANMRRDIFNRQAKRTYDAVEDSMKCAMQLTMLERAKLI
jgi:hypothetical protein